jgi:sugar/nucleoside kinase (ribokinase family)
VLFANREELAMMTGFGSESPVKHNFIIEAAGYLADIVVMKIGAEGCMILNEGRVTPVSGETVSPLDTTGAGDSFAAGFLYGLLKGKDLATSGAIANTLASQIVTVEGCDYSAIDSSIRRCLSG